MSFLKSIALVAAIGTGTANGMYYLPGVLPHSYEDRESVRCRTY